MTDYMVTGLVKKRGEVAGEIASLHDRINQLVKDLDHIDGTLRIVAPDMPVESIRPKMFRPPDEPYRSEHTATGQRAANIA